VGDANRWSADAYAKLAAFDGDWRDTWWNDDFLALMANRWRFDDVRDLLDVGCGVGHWSQRLLRFLPPDAHVVAVDREAGFRHQSLARAEKLGFEGRFAFHVGAADALPFPDDSFDCVTCQTVLMHVPDASRTIREMMRVCRPGGIVIAAEPNNLVNGLQMVCGYPRLPWAEVSAFLAFDHVCREGKRALGEGDSAIGERLPNLFSEAGLTDVMVFNNDQCAWLQPPYDTRRQRIDLEQLLQFFRSDVALTGGTRDEALRRFCAGGGQEPDFEAGWELCVHVQRGFEKALSAGKLHGSRGFLHYIASGRKAGT
jgi:SAM-dependent methyltransferase